MATKQRQFRDLDSSLFKAFLFSARELNFTRAATLAGMTQSGVSQKIAKLEQELGHSLFARVNKSLSLTETGRTLLDYVEKQQSDLQVLFESLGQGSRSLSGPVAYAMPHSCLFTPHFPLLLEARNGFAQVTLKIELCPNEDVIAKLIERKIDFGFITRRSGNPALEHIPFAEEEYGLVGKRKSRNPFTLTEIENLPFVDYPGMQALFEIWRQAVFPSRRKMNYESLRIEGQINSLNGAVTMLTQGIGWTVLPLHVVESELKGGKLDHLQVAKKPVRSEIFLVKLKSVTQPERVEVVIRAFQKMKGQS